MSDDDLCEVCGKPRKPHRYRHRFVGPAPKPADVVPFEAVLPLLRDAWDDCAMPEGTWQALTPEQRKRVEGES